MKHSRFVGHGWLLVCCLLVGLALASGCSSRKSSPLEVANDQASVVLLPPQGRADEGLLESYTLNLDLGATTAKLERDRSGQRQGFIFDLDIANFLRLDSLTVQDIVRQPNGDLAVTLIHRHPFGAPDFSKPASGINRADLGYTGRLLVLADQAHSTFFGSTVSLDPLTLANPDGYLKAGGLLQTTGLTNDTFPYKLLVDEALDNRLGISNGANPTGNYAPGAGGWTRLNIGGNNVSWTGYDFLHQGQASTQKLVIRQGAFVAGSLSLRLAILIKYTDPRGGSTGAVQKTNRLPSATPNPLQFAYRLPHAALDSSVIRLLNTPHVTTLTNRCADVRLTVRDWDSVGELAADADLSDEPDVTRIPPGAKGIPSAELDAPFLSTTPKVAIVASYALGLPSNERALQVKLLNSLGTAAPGAYFACLRVIDPEESVDSTYHFGVDPETLAPTRPTLQSVYQIVPVTVEVPPVDAAGEPPSIYATPCEDGGQPLSSKIFTVGATNSPTNIDWDLGNGATPNNPTGAGPVVVLSATPGTYTASVVATNAFGSSTAYFSYEVYGGNYDAPPPSVHVSGASTVASGDGVLTLGVTAYADPNPGTVSVRFDWNRDGDYLDLGEGFQALTWPLLEQFPSPVTYNNPSLEALPSTIPYSYLYSTIGIADQKLAPFSIGPNQPPRVLAGNLALAQSQISSTTNFTVTALGLSVTDPESDPITYFVRGIPNAGPTRTAIGPSFPLVVGPYSNPATTGAVRISGFANDPTHPLTMGTRIPTSATSLQGTVLPVTGWAELFTAANQIGCSEPSAIAVDTVGNTYVCGAYDGSINFGGGVRASGGGPGISDIFVLKLDPAGVHVWDRVFATNQSEGAEAIHIDAAGNVLVAGDWINGPINFGGGPRLGLAGIEGFVVKLDSAGNYVWDQTWIGLSGQESCHTIGSDVALNVYAGGEFSSAINFGGGLRFSAGVEDSNLVKYDLGGNWLADYQAGSTGPDKLYDLEVSGGLLGVTGVYGGPINFGGGVRANASTVNGYAMQFSTGLTYQWDQTYTSSGTVFGRSIVTDTTGNYLLGGSFSGSTNFGGGLRLATGLTDGYVVMLDASGNYAWDRQYGSLMDDQIRSVSFDANDNPWLVGSFAGSLDFGGGSRNTAGLSDIFLVNLTPGGSYRLDRTIGGTLDDLVGSIMFAPDGDLRYGVGFKSANVDFNPGPATRIFSAGSNFSMTISRLNSNGEF